VQLPNEVSDLARRIIGYSAEAFRAEVRAKFQIGDEIHAMRYSPSCGGNAIRALARQLVLDESGLLRIARVAARFSPREREALLSMTDARGLPLTWSHLEELQRVPSACARADLAQLALRDRLSVRELRRHVAKWRGDSLRIGSTTRNGR
jgi:hypothetical protein